MNNYEIDNYGKAWDRQSRAEVATFADDGNIYSQGTKIGFVGTDGVVYDANGNRLGTVSSDGTVYNNNGQVGRVEPPNVHRQGALMLLL